MNEAALRPHGTYVGGDPGEGIVSMPVNDKYTGDTLGLVPVASQTMIESAIAAAFDAFPSYSRTTAHFRSSVLNKAADLLYKYREIFTVLLCREAGKPWKYSAAEVDRCLETFRFSAEEAKRIHGETIPMDASSSGEGRVGFSLRTPVGVVGAITPFNFPLNLVAHKIGPALAAGRGPVRRGRDDQHQNGHDQTLKRKMSSPHSSLHQLCVVAPSSICSGFSSFSA